MSVNKKKLRLGTLVICGNVLLIGILVLTFWLYNKSYDQKIQQQNLSNIRNLNTASESLAEKFFENQQEALKNMARYIQSQKFSLEETLDYLYESNAEDAGIYEVIGADYTGYLAEKNADGQYYAMDYSSHDYAQLHKNVDMVTESNVGVVAFAPEFTDCHTAIKSFGMYASIPVKMEDGSTAYMALFSLSRAKDFSDMFQMQGSYASLSSVIFDDTGNYIIDSDKFKSDNFFQYLYIYNELSLEQKNEIKKQVTSSERGTMYYANEAGKNCVYIYTKMKSRNWYIVTGVPLDEFQQTSNDFGYTIIVVVLLGLLMAMDLLWFQQMNRKLKCSMEQEIKANNAKSDFLARMSHDIRTPLNAVIGFSELAAEEEKLSKDMENSLQKINSSGRYLLGLINDILDMSKIENNKFELHETKVHEKQFLMEIADVLEAQARQRGITFVTDFSGVQNQWVYMDALRSRQVYSNLLNNALKFSAAGTTITWKASTELVGKDEVHIESRIIDQGCGMSKEFMEHIFTPFEQEHNIHSDKEAGTGLGLSIVKNLVELMGGSIQVESELGKGSTFTVRLKRRLSEPEVDAAASKDAKEDLQQLAGRRILLCEDHPVNREIAIRLLKKQKLEVEWAENGLEGLKKFEASPLHYYQAILMDIRMPVMNGIETTQKIRKLEREDAASIPIIAMTANAFEDDVQNCLKVGMNAHIAKPIETKILYKTLTDWIG